MEDVTQATGAIKVAVVEDDPGLRFLLSEVLGSSPDCCCVGAFRDVRSALADLPGIMPDVIIMDVNLPDGSGVECVAQLAPQLPGTRIVMLTVYQDAETIFGALAAGAHGYLVKPIQPRKLLEAVREIHEGGVPMSRTIACRVLEAFRHPVTGSSVEMALEEVTLTSREREVLDFLVRGYTYKEIGREMAIKASTVATFVRRIYEKLHVRSRREVMARCQGATREL